MEERKKRRRKKAETESSPEFLLLFSALRFPAFSCVSLRFPAFSCVSCRSRTEKYRGKTMEGRKKERFKINKQRG